MNRSRKVLSHLVCILIIFLFGLFVYRNVIFSSGSSFQKNDIKEIFYPVFYFAKHALLQGQFPLWDPYQLFGQPITFNTYPILYPPLLLFLALPFKEFLPRHLELFIVFHMIAAGFTLYYSGLRLGLQKWGSLAASIIFMSAPVITSFIFMPAGSFMMPWIPLVLVHTITIFSSEKPIRNEKTDFIILILSLVMIILTVCPPILLFIYITIGLIFLFFLFSYVNRLSRIFLIIKKFTLILTIPVLLTFFLLLPLNIYLKETARSVPAPQNVGVGPLYLAHIWTLLFPRFAFGMSDSFAYIGILPFIFILFLLPFAGRYIYPGKMALLSFLSSFWFVFAIEKSPLYYRLALLPVLNSLRFSYRGLLIYVITSSLLVGMIIDLLCEREKKGRYSFNLFNFILQLSLPIVLICSLLVSYKYFVGIKETNPLFPDGAALKYYLRNFSPAIIGFILISIFSTTRKIKDIKYGNNLFWIIPVIVIITEYSLNYNTISVKKTSVQDPFYPYSDIVENVKERFPEITEDISMARIEDFGEATITPYYYKYFSVNGSGTIAQATHPRVYYYLWSRGGKWYGHTYQKPYIDIMRDAINVDSPLYSLMGVRFFVISNEGAGVRMIPYEERGKSEYITANFKEPQKIKGIKIINPEGDFKRRVTKLEIEADGKLLGVFNLENASGEQTIEFVPIIAKNIKMTVLDVGLNGFPTSNGVFIEEIEFLDDKLEEIEIDNIETSSTFWLSDRSYLTDREDTLWESGNMVGIRKKMVEANCRSIRDELFEKTDFMPRAFFLSNYKVVNSEEALLECMHSENFNPRKEVLLFKKPSIQENDYYVTARIDKYRLNKVEISVDNDYPGLLILTDSFSKGWEAYLNGKKSEIVKAYGVFRAVEIPDTGRNMVIFRYLPPYFKLGSIISLITLICLIIKLF